MCCLPPSLPPPLPHPPKKDTPSVPPLQAHTRTHKAAHTHDTYRIVGGGVHAHHCQRSHHRHRPVQARRRHFIEVFERKSNRWSGTKRRRKLSAIYLKEHSEPYTSQGKRGPGVDGGAISCGQVKAHVCGLTDNLALHRRWWRVGRASDRVCTRACVYASVCIPGKEGEGPEVCVAEHLRDGCG